jgi:hypothetical protein
MSTSLARCISQGWLLYLRRCSMHACAVVAKSLARSTRFCDQSERLFGGEHRGHILGKTGAGFRVEIECGIDTRRL